MKIEEIIVPITEEVSVSSLLINELSRYAFPDIFEMIEVIDRLTDEAVEAVYNPKLSFEENKKLGEIYYNQRLLETILEKGRDENV